MKISKTMIVIIILIIVNLWTYLFDEPKPVTLITNDQNFANQVQGFPSMPAAPLQPPNGVQIVRSLLGLQVKFLNGTVSYPGLLIVNDPRYQALAPKEKLVDALRFQSPQAPTYFLLIAIAKNSNGAPLIVPGKFNFVQTTAPGGLVLKDPQGRLFYYSGYVTTTPGWQNLVPGQMIEDNFCKVPTQQGMCSPQNTVRVLLKKPVDPRKDIPFLALVR